MRNYSLAGITLTFFLGIWAALSGQQPAAQPKDAAGQIQLLEERVSALEKLAPGWMSSGGTSGVSLETRLGRIEDRLSRIEAEATRYRPGTSSSAGQLESRLSALEREIARLRR